MGWETAALTLTFTMTLAALAPTAHAYDRAELLPEGMSVSSLGLEDADWDRILDHKGSKILFGVSLQGPSPYARNNTLSFLPASNSKLFTAGAALERLGVDARFETRLRWKRVSVGSDTEITGLEMIGSGDPSWGVAGLEATYLTRADALAHKLRARGVRVVYGAPRALADDARWNTLRYPEGWGSFVATSCNTAMAQAFNIALNCATYVVKSATEGAWAEQGVPTKVKLSLKRGSRTDVRVRALGIEGDGVSQAFELVGTINEARGAVRVRLPVHQSALWAERLLASALRRAGIAQRRLSSKITASGDPAQELSHLSPTLGEILKPFLKHSINTLGEALFKILGARFGSPQTELVLAAQEVMREYAGGIGAVAALAIGEQPRAGFFSNEVGLYDGSGISRESHVTTSAMMALLLDLRARADFAILLDALPLAGVDGTLQNRMRGTPAQGRLHAKTGTLDGVYNLSGYVPRLDANGVTSEQVPFVTLTRTTSENIKEAHDIQDQIGAELARILSKPLM